MVEQHAAKHGFFYNRRKEAGDAAKKAFIVNRIGDFGYMIAIFIVFNVFGTISFVDKAIGGASGESRRALRDSPDAPGNSTFWVFGAIASPWCRGQSCNLRACRIRTSSRRPRRGWCVGQR